MRWACPSDCLFVCLFVCLSVCRQNAKTRFSQKLSNLQLWRPIESRTWAFQRTHYWTPKVLYTLATKSTVAETRNKLVTKSTVADTVDFVADLSPVLATHWRQSRIRQLVAVDFVANSATLSPVCTGPKRHGLLCRLSTKSTVSNSSLCQCVPGLKSNLRHPENRHDVIFSIFSRGWSDLDKNSQTGAE